MHAVLRELERAGFDGAPRFLGIDAQGRERLSYLPGWVAPDLAHGDWSDEQLGAATELVRRFHDVLGRSALAARAETVCHRDLGPCNTVHVEGMPRAFIDWDGAAPGSRALDLGHAVWRWAISSDTGELPLDEQVRRVRLMSDAYGGVDGRALLEGVAASQDRSSRPLSAVAMRDRAAGTAASAHGSTPIDGRSPPD